MPTNSAVGQCYDDLIKDGHTPESAARICQASTGEALATGKPPKKSKAIVAIDLHNTIAEGERENPTPQAGAIDALQQLRDDGHHVAVWTCWDTDKATNWLDANKIPYDTVNTAPERFETTSPKIDCDAYVDDKSVFHDGDWPATMELLAPKLIGKSFVRVKSNIQEKGDSVFGDRTVVEQGFRILNGVGSAVKAILGQVGSGRLDPKQASSKIWQMTWKANDAIGSNFQNRYQRLLNVVNDKYGKNATDDGWWSAVKGVFKDGRDQVRMHIEEMRKDALNALEHQQKHGDFPSGSRESIDSAIGYAEHSLSVFAEHFVTAYTAWKSHHAPGKALSEDEASVLCELGYDEKTQVAKAIVTKRMKGVQVGEPHDRVVTYVMTSTSEDRDGETVDPTGGNFDEYALNPTVQFNHDTDNFGIGSMGVDLAGPVPEGQTPVHPKVSIWNEPIGEGTRWPQVGGEKRMALLGNVYFSKVGEESEKAFQKVKEGTLKGGSVSFAPMGQTQKNANGGNHYSKWRLLEFTICPVGSNGDAISLTKGLKRKVSTFDIAGPFTTRGEAEDIARKTNEAIAILGT